MSVEGADPDAGVLAARRRDRMLRSLAALGSVAGWWMGVTGVPGSIPLMGIALVAGWAGAYRQGSPRILLQSLVFAGVSLLFAYSALLFIIGAVTVLQR